MSEEKENVKEENKDKEAVKEQTGPKESKKEEKPVEEKKDEKKKIELYERQNDELKSRLTQCQKKAEDAEHMASDWKNRYYQAYADMSNTRKQVERETSDFKKYAKQALVEELIPALDGFDMALKNEPKDDVIRKYLQGFVMIHSKLLTILKQQDVSVIDPKPGDEYNPDTMQAYSTVEGEEDNKVAEVFTKGYKMFDHLLRPAGVIVTRKKEVEENKEEVKKEDTKAEESSGKTEETIEVK